MKKKLVKVFACNVQHIRFCQTRFEIEDDRLDELLRLHRSVCYS